MKNLINNIKKHKIGTAILGICLVGVIGVGTGFGIHQAKVANTQKALLLAQDGYIDTEELNQLGEDIVLGEEIVAPDGSTVVITKDESGNYVTTTVRDSAGNNTGAVVPGGNTGGGDSPNPSPTPSPTPTPAHVHTFVPHYTIVHHDAVTQQVCVSPAGAACNTCGAICATGAECGEHTHTTGHGGWHTVAAQYETQIVQAAWDEQILDYYYCSECGAHQ